MFGDKPNTSIKFQDIFRTKPQKFHILGHTIEQRKKFRIFPGLLKFPGQVETLFKENTCFSMCQYCACLFWKVQSYWGCPRLGKDC